GRSGRWRMSNDPMTMQRATPSTNLTTSTVVSWSPNKASVVGVLQRQCACGTHTMGGEECTECQKKQMNGRPLQAKLAISEPGDVHEQEADRVAGQVLQLSPMDLSRRQHGNRTQPLVQRRASSGATGVAEAPPIVREVLTSPGQSLEPTTRTFFESRFGHDFSQVRVHTDAKAAESAQAVNALAYTVGRDVVFGAEQYTPMTPQGGRLLAHELTHVVQQGKSSHIGEIAYQVVADVPTPETGAQRRRSNATATLPALIASIERLHLRASQRLASTESRDLATEDLETGPINRGRSNRIGGI